MKNFEQIEQYLRGEMSESQRESFEEKMKNDDAFAEEVRIQQFEESAIDLMIEDDFLKKIKKIAAEEKEHSKIIPPKKKKSSLLYKRWLPISAAACILLLVGFYIFSTDANDKDYQTLASSSYLKRVPNFPLTRSTENSNNQEYDKYCAYITNQEVDKMEETITYLKKINSLESQYRAGHACLLIKDYKCAIQQLNEVLSSKKNNQTSDFQVNPNYINFYLAIAYLGNHQIEKVKQILQPFEHDINFPYRKEVKTILGQLN